MKVSDHDPQHENPIEDNFIKIIYRRQRFGIKFGDGKRHDAYSIRVVSRGLFIHHN